MKELRSKYKEKDSKEWETKKKSQNRAKDRDSLLIKIKYFEV